MSNTFPSSLRDLLQGTPWGEQFPPKDNPKNLSIDGRTAALRILREYICALQFYRAGPKNSGTTIPFKIDPANFNIEWPDSTKDEVFPSIAIVNSRADYDVIGLVAYIEEDTKDLFVPGTVLQWQAEYVETINVEVWASKKAERRAILAGIETALSPVEQMSGLRFKMPEYYGELVCFTLNRREVMDEPDSARNRRRAQLEIEMRFNIVKLVNYRTLSVSTTVNTDVDQATNTPVDLSTDPNAQVTGDLALAISQSQQFFKPNSLFVKHVSSYTADNRPGAGR